MKEHVAAPRTYTCPQSIMTDASPSVEPSPPAGEAKLVSPPYQENAWDEEKQEDEPTDDAKPHRRTSMLRMSDGKANAPNRKDHLRLLMNQRRASMHYVKAALAEGTDEAVGVAPKSVQDLLSSEKKKDLDQDAVGIKDAVAILKKLQSCFPTENTQVSVRMTDFSYEVNVDTNSNKIQTVFNQSLIYSAIKSWKIVRGKEKRPEKGRKFVLQNVTLNFEPGKMILVLGPPRSGKTSLLKAIAGRLSTVNEETITGSVEYNGIKLGEMKSLYVDNMIAFVSSFDFHAVSAMNNARHDVPLLDLSSRILFYSHA